jgi:hypothetical protein
MPNMSRTLTGAVVGGLIAGAIVLVGVRWYSQDQSPGTPGPVFPTTSGLSPVAQDCDKCRELELRIEALEKRPTVQIDSTRRAADTGLANTAIDDAQLTSRVLKIIGEHEAERAQQAIRTEVENFTTQNVAHYGLSPAQMEGVIGILVEVRNSLATLTFDPAASAALGSTRDTSSLTTKASLQATKRWATAALSKFLPEHVIEVILIGSIPHPLRANWIEADR